METLNKMSILSDKPATAIDAPEWFIKSQDCAWQTFLDAPAPTNRSEQWRFGNRKQLNFEEYSPAAFLDTEDVDIQIEGLEEASAQFIFANDGIIHAEADLPDGVICLPLEDALQQHSELVQKYFAQNETKLGSAKYAALHLANAQAGLFVYVPKGIEIEKPIECYHIVSGDKATIFPHTLIITEENAKVSVIDYFKSGETSPGLVIAMNDLTAAPGSTLSYTSVQDLNLDSKLISVSSLETSRDARIKSFNLNIGASWVRNESHSRLTGNGAHTDMLSLNIASGTQEYDQRTFQSHEAAHTYSDLLYKNTSYGKAKTTFSGLISVDDGAHFTDAYQTCRNLLMDDTTEANSMPGLQINADNVKCSHGSTVSAISDEEIFYLQARGIHAVSARQLIARGFNIEVIEKIEDEKIEELMLKYVDQKFSSVI